VPFLPALANPAASAASEAERAASVKTLYDSLTQEQFMAQTRMALSGMFTDPADIERAGRWAAQADPAAVGVAVSEMMTTYLRARSGRIASPVLLIGALGAAHAPMRASFRAAYQAQVAAVPNVTVLFAERARHFVMLDDPEFFFPALESFLLRVRTSDRTSAAGGRGR
jgi:pimeloyl-ACP methyl ester carboxylesterase